MEAASPGQAPPPDRWWQAAGYGISAGFATTVANAAGPVMNLYLLARRLPKHEFVATGAWFFFVVNLVKLPIYAFHGLIDRRSLMFDLALAPSVVAGALLGRALLHRLPQATVRQAGHGADGLCRRAVVAAAVIALAALRSGASLRARGRSSERPKRRPPMANEKTILITGATGKQGGATLRHLAKRGGFKLRAMTRKPDSDAAKALAALGRRGGARATLDDAASLERAFAGAWGVFAVQNTWEAGVEKEEEQGKRVAKIARDKGVQHFVYTSVGSADEGTGIPHFENKFRVEQTIKQLGFPSHVILRPVFFMENLPSAVVPQRRQAGHRAEAGDQAADGRGR